ncbi:hypothetical protein, partial [Streptomyces sp. SID10815]|uniref:hypothetical protein n=1 Tax=Streptomyces sp. SID10815 TaxID=2706027 RepID=UPI0019432593
MNDPWGVGAVTPPRRPYATPGRGDESPAHRCDVRPDAGHGQIASDDEIIAAAPAVRRDARPPGRPS